MNELTEKPIFSAKTLSEWLTHLEQLHPNVIDLGLARITQVAERLNLTHFEAKVITVAGTNGKGTTCAYLEKILIDNGFKVGVYSSPHIHRYNERLRINLTELDDSVHCDAFAVIEKARGDISLSYFEFATLACLYILQQQRCDYMVLEVGLGGRLDATNLVQSDIAVITTIAIDHVDWLGSDREIIGFEKAGIFKAGKVAICGEIAPPDSILAHALSLSVDLRLANRDFHYQVIDKHHWSWQGKHQLLSPIKQTLMPMQNASTALAVVEALALDIDHHQLIASLESASLAGRLQKLNGYPCDLYIDVAHNPQSAEYLASQLQRLKNEKIESCKIHAVVGMLSDKDMVSTLSEINAQIDSYNFVDLNCYRGASAEMLLNAFQQSKNNQCNVTCFKNVTLAVDKVLENVDASDIVIIFGSFHTVSDMLNNFQG